MLTAEDYDLLARVEKDAPMGKIMRAHWLPACMTEEVAERDGAPVRTRLLGEVLVVFRDTQRRIVCLGEHCLYRVASLAFGLNEECGLRCLYHGWKFDVDGNVLDMSCEPATGALMGAHIKQKPNPACEGGGFVWSFMGARETMPKWQPPAWAPAPT